MISLLPFTVLANNNSSGVVTIDEAFTAGNLQIIVEGLPGISSATDVIELHITATSGELDATDIAYLNTMTSLQILDVASNIAVDDTGHNFFRNQDHLTEATFPATSFGAYAFENCDVLTSVNLPNAISFEDYAFENCINLTTVSIPLGETFGLYAFNYCTGLTSISLPAAVSFEYHAFGYCGLTTVSLDNATTFGGYAFYDCDNLASITLPSATSFGNNAFANCDNLTSVSLEVATSFGDKMYDNSPNPIIMTLGNTIPTLTPASSYDNYDPEGKGAAVDVPQDMVISYDEDDGITDNMWYGWTLVTDPKTVIFDSNGGSEVPMHIVENGSSLSEPSNPTRNGYTFTGWYTDEECTTLWNFDDPVTGNMTLYAGWDAEPHVISYRSNGGIGTIADTTDVTDSPITLSDGSGFSRAGYTLTKWNDAPDGSGTSYSLGETTTMPPEDLILYAVWTANPYTLHYDPNGGAGTISDVTIKTDSKIILSDGSGFTQNLYTLAGWSTKSGDNNSVEYLLGEVYTMSPEDVTLYAVWKKCETITATLDIQGSVKDTSGNPVSGVTVVLNSATRTTTTNSAGWYYFNDVTIETHYFTFRYGTEELGRFTIDLRQASINYVDISNDGSSGIRDGHIEVGANTVDLTLELSIILNDSGQLIIDGGEIITPDTNSGSENP